MEYTREEWEEDFPGEPYPGDTTVEEMNSVLSMILPPPPFDLEEE